MKLKNKKRIAAQLLKAGIKRVWFNPDKLSEIKDAITKEDIRNLIREGSIRVKQKRGISRFRVRKILVQKRKGRRQGPGTRKGKATARLSKKRDWMNRVRKQRELLSVLKNKKAVTPKEYSDLRLKTKGGFFRSKRHLKLYLEEKYGKK